MKLQAVSANVVDFNKQKQWAKRMSQVANATLQSGSRIDNFRKIPRHNFCICTASTFL